ncbi:MAG: TIGR01777 family protein [Chlamydiales bacterium]|nr:TIGR01777 family oxidoreductase [Chlamydiia bacterium]MCP5508664.1 TIGR01777 family protein [Chlamydiales bacterium]
MKILIAGASGLIGHALVDALEKKGHQVITLVRKKNLTGPEAVFWDPEQQQLDPDQIEGVDAIINLAGENVASGRWSDDKKKNIHDSRVNCTMLLSSTVAKLRKKPHVWINASAIGYYGDRGNEPLTENSAPGSAFLSKVCQDWETAVSSGGTRVVVLRIGIVLSGHGGALKRMLPPFKMGLGGILGTGQQYMSWIALPDLVDIFLFALEKESLSGPVNAVSPQPLTNQEFTETLGSFLGRPTVFPVPAFAARLLFGEMADELLLSSARVVPEKLQQSGYAFKYPYLENALEAVLNPNQNEIAASPPQ